MLTLSSWRPMAGRLVLAATLLSGCDKKDIVAAPVVYKGPLAETTDVIILMSDSARLQVRLTAPLTFGTLGLAPALNDFALRYPGIELDVSFTDRIVHLIDDGFDMALRIGRSGDSSLIMRRLCGVRLVVVAAQEYLRRKGRPEAPGDLAAHACIIDTNFRDPNRWPFRDQDGAERMVGVSGRIRYSNAEACLKAAAAGLGIACVPAFCVAWPTAKKIADLISECTVICSSPPKLAIGPPTPNAKVIMPMCSIDEYANSRLTSF